MIQLKSCGHKVDLKILDNEARLEYTQVIEESWQAQFQCVPPNFHLCNAAEQEIQTFRDNLLAILEGVAPYFSPYLWDFLFRQTEMTINLLRQATLNQRISVW